jgi:hypothetical protein
MKQYLNNLLPRIKQFSESLDKKESFIDTPWVIVDEDLNQQKYIFKRNGELIMSLNGQVSIGKWEYLSNYQFSSNRFSSFPITNNLSRNKPPFWIYMLAIVPNLKIYFGCSA